MKPEWMFCQTCRRPGWANYKNGQWICQQCGEIIATPYCKECGIGLLSNEHDYCSRCVSGREHAANLKH